MDRTRLTRFGMIILAAFAIAACGSAPEVVAESDTTVRASNESSLPTSEAPTTTSRPATSTSAEATTTSTESTLAGDPVPLESVVGGTIRGEGWLVEPGVYTRSLGDLELQFSITEPVVYFGYEGVVFGPDTSSPTQDLFVLTEFVGVIPPERAGEHADHEPIVPLYTEPVPENLGSWLDSVTQLEVSASADLNAPNVEGSYWEVEVDGEGATFHCGFGSCVSALVHETSGVFVLFEDGLFRIWQLQGESDGVFGFLQSSKATYAEMTEMAEMIFQGMTVTPAS